MSSFSEWNATINKLEKQRQERDEAALVTLRKMTEELEPSAFDNEKLLATYCKAQNSSNHYNPRFAELYTRAAEKLRKEILKRMESNQ